jgi:hypothetical protein
MAATKQNWLDCTDDSPMFPAALEEGAASLNTW